MADSDTARFTTLRAHRMADERDFPRPTPTAPPPGRPLAPLGARVVAGGALLAGIVGETAFADGLSGVGLTAFLLTATAAIGAAADAPSTTMAATTLLGGNPLSPVRPRPVGWDGARRLGAGALLMFAALAALLQSVRTSGVLVALDLLAVFGAGGLAIAMLQPEGGVHPWSMRVRDVLRIAAVRVADAASGALRFMAFDASGMLRPADSAQSRLWRAVARAMLLALAIVLVPALLLASGDPVFRGASAWLTDWSASWLATHTARACLFAWPVLGATYAVARPARLEFLAEHGVEQAAANVRLNRLDMLVGLGALNALFGSFVLLQLRALFGGQAYLLDATGLTVAQYARSGFFTLVLAVSVVMGVLLAVDARAARDSLASWPVARRLCRTLLALLVAVLASALVRMGLYVQAFGLSIDRTVALLVIAWLATVFVLFDRTVLRGRAAGFTAGAILSAGALLLAFNVANPEALVVRSAVSRAARGADVDVDYLTRELGPDAMPALATAVASGRFDHARIAAPATTTTSTTPSTTAPITAACRIAWYLLDWSAVERKEDWRAWSYGRARAMHAIDHNEASLRAACPSP